MITNSNHKLFVASGHYDLATPYFAMDYTVNHLGLSPVRDNNITQRYYPAGHMMYVHEPSIQQLRNDLINLAQLKNTFETVYPDLGTAEQVTAAVGDATRALNGWEFRRPDGSRVELNVIGVDIGFESDRVYAGLVESGHKNVLAVRGVGVTASKRPMAGYSIKPGGRRGNHWILDRDSSRELPSLKVDVNYWKTQVHRSFLIPMESDDALRLYKVDRPRQHEQIAKQWTRERAKLITDNSSGRSVQEWFLPPSGN